MKVKENRESFIEFMDDNNLSAKQVAKLLDRELVTIQAYRSKAGVDIPNHSFQLLKLLVNKEK